MQKNAHRTRLTPAEKQRMRVALYEAMEQVPLGAGTVPSAPARSPYVFVSFLRPRIAVPLVVLAVVLAGSGTAYAAQGALPDSPLYAVKVGVNEPVRLALAMTPAAKAAVDASIAQTRVEEAQALEAQGRLDATTTAELEQNFDQHAAAALALLGSTTPATSTVSITVAGEATSSEEATTTERATSAPGRAQHASAAFAASSSEATSTEATAESAAAQATSSEQVRGAASATQNIPELLARQRQLLQEIRQRVDEQVQERDAGGRSQSRRNTPNTPHEASHGSRSTPYLSKTNVASDTAATIEATR